MGATEAQQAGDLLTCWKVPQNGVGGLGEEWGRRRGEPWRRGFQRKQRVRGGEVTRKEYGLTPILSAPLGSYARSWEHAVLPPPPPPLPFPPSCSPSSSLLSLLLPHPPILLPLPSCFPSFLPPLSFLPHAPPSPSPPSPSLLSLLPSSFPSPPPLPTPASPLFSPLPSPCPPPSSASLGAAAARGPLADQLAEVARGAVVKRGAAAAGGGSEPPPPPAPASRPRARPPGRPLPPAPQRVPGPSPNPAGPWETPRSQARLWLSRQDPFFREDPLWGVGLVSPPRGTLLLPATSISVILITVVIIITS